jgi:integrase
VDVDQWLRALTDSEGNALAGTTRNNFQRVLIVAFNFAHDRGYHAGNPALKSAKAKIVESEAGILTVDELSRLLENAPDGLVPYIAIGAFAGLRRAELERLDWKEVDLADGLILITAKKSKSARRRHVQIKPNLALWLKPYAQNRGSVTPAGYRKLLRKARMDAGIKSWPNNALRHSFASYHLAHFQKEGAGMLAAEMGHTNATLVYQHYRQLVKPKQAAQYWSVIPASDNGTVVALNQAA